MIVSRWIFPPDRTRESDNQIWLDLEAQINPRKKKKKKRKRTQMDLGWFAYLREVYVMKILLILTHFCILRLAMLRAKNNGRKWENASRG